MGKYKFMGILFIFLCFSNTQLYADISDSQTTDISRDKSYRFSYPKTVLDFDESRILAAKQALDIENQDVLLLRKKIAFTLAGYLKDINSETYSVNGSNIDIISAKIRDGEELYIKIWVYLCFTDDAATGNPKMIEAVNAVIDNKAPFMMAEIYKLKEMYAKAFSEYEFNICAGRVFIGLPDFRAIDTYKCEDKIAIIDKWKQIQEKVKSDKSISENELLGEISKKICSGIDLDIEQVISYDNTTAFAKGESEGAGIVLFLLLNFGYLNYATLTDGNWPYTLLIDGSAAMFFYAINTLESQSLMKNVFIGTYFVSSFSYPVYGLIDGYINKDSGEITRAWIGLAIGAISAYSIFHQEQRCGLTQEQPKNSFFNLSPVASAAYLGVETRLLF